MAATMNQLNFVGNAATANRAGSLMVMLNADSHRFHPLRTRTHPDMEFRFLIEIT